MTESEPPALGLAQMVATLERINHARATGMVSEEDAAETLCAAASTRLAVYGSLAPGELNHHHIAPLAGSWLRGRVRGVVRMKGWGSHVGFPGMTWTKTADDFVPVRLFTSQELPAHWDRLDDFEGNDYLRILVPVEGIGNGPVVANLYGIRHGDG